MPELQPWQWALGAVCAMFVGIAKTGMPGFGISAIPLMVFVAGNARASAGWLLPILCVADLFGIAYFRRHASARRLFELVPWVAIGWVAGAGLMMLDQVVGDRALRRVVGVIVALMLAALLWRKRRGDRPVPSDWHHHARYGVAAGFSTVVANAAGPVMNLYLLSRRLPKEEFVATGAWFFFIINLTKVPFYGATGLIDRGSLVFDACMLPAVALGALVGRSVLRRLPQGVFEKAVLALTTVAVVLLFVRG